MMIEPRVGTPERDAWQKDKNRRASALMLAFAAKAGRDGAAEAMMKKTKGRKGGKKC